MTFYDWVLAQMPADKRTAAEAARRFKVSESTVGRWRTGGVKMDTVRQVVDALPGSSILGAIVAAGILNEEEAGVTVVSGPPRELTDEELIAELEGRLIGRAQREGLADGEGKSSSLRPEDAWRDEFDLAAQRKEGAKGADPGGLDDDHE